MQNLSDYTFSKESTSLSDKLIGFVLIPNSSKSKNDRDDRDKLVGAYIPQLMSQIEVKNGAWSKNFFPSQSIISNSNFEVKFDAVVERNYFNLTPYRISNIEQPLLSKGEHFYCQFIDGDIKKGKYLPELVNEKNRKTDRFRTFISADGEEYEFLMDSAEGHIKINLPGGKDAIGYKLDFNSANGKMELIDSNGQGTFIDSNSETITVKSNGKIINETNGCVLEVNGGTNSFKMIDNDGKGITSQAGIITVKSNNKIINQSGGCLLEVDGSAGTLNMSNGSQGIYISNGTIRIKADTIHLDSSNIIQ